jgi:uncharacterized protein YndB with AHSA1/START domain
MASTARQSEKQSEKQSQRTLEIRRTFAAPRERVFNAWTRAEELRRWFSPGPMTTPVAEVDLRVGGRYRIVMRAPDGAEHTVTGVYRTIDAPRRLVFTWQWADKPDPVETIVTIDFKEQGKSTEVLLRHEGHPTETERASHEHGWHGCLEKLGTAL